MLRYLVLILSILGAIAAATGIVLGIRDGRDGSTRLPPVETAEMRPDRRDGSRFQPARTGRPAVRRVDFVAEPAVRAPIQFADDRSLAATTRGQATTESTDSRRSRLPRRSSDSLRRPPLQPLDLEQLESTRGRDPASRRPILTRVLPRQETVPPASKPSAPSDLAPTDDDWYRPAREVTGAMAARRDRIRQVLQFYYHERPLNTRDDSPWSMMHHMLAWGVDGYVHVGGPDGRRASVIAWLCGNGRCQGERLMELGPLGLQARLAPGLQGHEGQLLAMFAQARVAIDQQLRVQGRMFTIKDLIATEQATCQAPSELTFKLMGLIHYLPTEASWRNQRGESWNFARLMEEEIRAPINGVTCGGTHRLMALAYAVRRRRRDGLPVEGTWERARRHVASYQHLAFQLQNRDGSLSSDFFRKRGSWGDPDRKLRTTGHVLEWLVFSLPHDQLQDGRVTAAVDYLCNLLINNRYYDWGKGHVGHSLRALSLYEERLFGTRPGERQFGIARRDATTSAR